MNLYILQAAVSIVTYCSWLFQATLGRLSFGTRPPPPPWWLKGAMQISVIGHALEVPIPGLTRALHDQGGRFIRFQMAIRGWSHGIELWFDTELGDE